MTWPKDKADKLKQMWNQGIEIGPIAKELGTSKIAAYSKVRRLGLRLHYKKKSSIPSEAGDPMVSQAS